MQDAKETVVVGVPGPWGDRPALMRALIRPGLEPKVLFMGGGLLELNSKTMQEVALQGPDPALVESFQIAGQGKVPSAVLNQISQHAGCAYVVETGRGLDAVRRVMRFVTYLLDAGGFAAKVECSGVAHTAEKWRYLTQSPSTLSAYEAMVTLVGGREFSYSCGMHAFGLPDTSVTTKVSIDKAAEVLTAFNHRQLLMGPFQEGEEFSTGASEPAFRIRKQPYGYEPDSLLNNPFGRWHLELAPARAVVGQTFQARGGPLFMAMRSDDLALQAAVEEARRTLPYFVAQAKAPFEYGLRLFKVRVQNGVERGFLWVRLVEVEGESLVGEFFEAPAELGVKVGQTITLPARESSGLGYSQERNADRRLFDAARPRQPEARRPERLGAVYWFH